LLEACRLIDIQFTEEQIEFIITKLFDHSKSFEAIPIDNLFSIFNRKQADNSFEKPIQASFDSFHSQHEQPDTLNKPDTFFQKPSQEKQEQFVSNLEDSDKDKENKNEEDLVAQFQTNNKLEIVGDNPITFKYDSKDQSSQLKEKNEKENIRQRRKMSENQLEEDHNDNTSNFEEEDEKYNQEVSQTENKYDFNEKEDQVFPVEKRNSFTPNFEASQMDSHKEGEENKDHANYDNFEVEKDQSSEYQNEKESEIVEDKNEEGNQDQSEEYQREEEDEAAHQRSEQNTENEFYENDESYEKESKLYLKYVI